MNTQKNEAARIDLRHLEKLDNRQYCYVKIVVSKLFTHYDVITGEDRSGIGHVDEFKAFTTYQEAVDYITNFNPDEYEFQTKGAIEVVGNPVHHKGTAHGTNANKARKECKDRQPKQKYQATLISYTPIQGDRDIETIDIEAKNDQEAKRLTTKHFKDVNLPYSKWGDDFNHKNVWVKMNWNAYYTEPLRIKLEKL